jgi:L-histidine N-alpha-methyltransferase
MNAATPAHAQLIEDIDISEPVAAGDEHFARDLIAGLSCAQKQVPSRYFYDGQGSDLFEQITRLPEYYPTRAEIEILRANAGAMAGDFEAGAALIEFGSGSSRKTEILLEAFTDLTAYVPIDVSADALQDAQARLGRRFPRLRVVPIQGDFTTMETWPGLTHLHKRIGFFPGSTIGNFTAAQAKSLLQRLARLLGPGSRLIIGVDLVKDRDVLLRAYDDASGVTARFNLNVLAHANRRFGAVVDLDSFEHRALYNEAEQRIEMHLVSKASQTVMLLGRAFHLAAKETIRTELSHKYTLTRFGRLATEAGWQPTRAWQDRAGLFSVHELIARVD